MEDIEESVLGRIEDGVGEIVLNRPARRNSLTIQDLGLFMRRLDEVEAAGIRALILHGAGEAFCAGRDLAEIDLETEDAHAYLARHANPLCARLRAFPVPTMAAVHGACLGLGFGLAMAADMVFAAEDARLGSPFRAIGCVPDTGAHFALAERIGRHRAAELIFTGRLIDGSEAARIGLINAALPRDGLFDHVRALAASIAVGPTLAFAESKAILLEGGDFDAMAEAEARAQARTLKSPDGREGVRAFLEKRPPVFGAAR